MKHLDLITLQDWRTAIGTIIWFWIDDKMSLALDDVRRQSF